MQTNFVSDFPSAVIHKYLYFILTYSTYIRYPNNLWFDTEWLREKMKQKKKKKQKQKNKTKQNKLTINLTKKKKKKKKKKRKLWRIFRSVHCVH